MDIDVIRAKQDSIARCIGRIQSKTDMSYAQFLDGDDAQDVVTMNLERAVQQACDIAAMILAPRSHLLAGPIDEPLRRLQLPRLREAAARVEQRHASRFRPHQPTTH